MRGYTRGIVACCLCAEEGDIEGEDAPLWWPTPLGLWVHLRCALKAAGEVASLRRELVDSLVNLLPRQFDHASRGSWTRQVLESEHLAGQHPKGIVYASCEPCMDREKTRAKEHDARLHQHVYGCVIDRCLSAHGLDVKAAPGYRHWHTHNGWVTDGSHTGIDHRIGRPHRHPHPLSHCQEED